MEYPENNKRIAKNTIFLYFRMLFTMGVSLYTSRIVLETLGIEDFGIYNVVGGVVALFSFLNNTLNTAISRFITFELGIQNVEKLKKTFSSALTVHFILAFIVLILAETIGLWFLENKLVIPENRMNAARIVYQMSILTTMIGIIQIPYNASIIAHERMNIYAYYSIIEVSLKLLIVYILYVTGSDKLVMYAILIFGITFLMALAYIYYSSKHFVECKFKLCYEKMIVVPMLSFSGWDLYGNISVVAKTQGVNVLQNLFFGPMVNAAGGIATQVQNAIAGFAENFLTAVRPQIVKNYAQGKIIEMQSLVVNSSKFAFLLLFCVSFPLILENKFVLNLWLKEVPDYAIIFCQLVLINNLISIIFRPVMYSIHATGRIKRTSFINGSVLFMTLPISYILFKMDYSPVTPYILNIVSLVICAFPSCYFLKLFIPQFSIFYFLKHSILSIFIIAFISSLIPIILHFYLDEGWSRFLLTGAIFVIVMGISIFYLALDKDMRKKIISQFTKKVIK